MIARQIVRILISLRLCMISGRSFKHPNWAGSVVRYFIIFLFAERKGPYLILCTKVDPLPFFNFVCSVWNGFLNQPTLSLPRIHTGTKQKRMEKEKEEC